MSFEGSGPITINPEAIAETTLKNVLADIRKRYKSTFTAEVRKKLSRVLELPGFVEKLKTLIPIRNERLALQTLEENLEYVQAFFEKEFPIEQIQDQNQDIASLTTEQQKKLAVELAGRAGYILEGPLQDIRSFEGDNRPGEKLCTFNDVFGRLNTYHILWLRHRNYQKIKPADELRDESDLSEEWRDYLEEQGRWDSKTDTYNLKGLQPQREDPYGTSSMSVQISKTGRTVILTNRYNHTLSGNPDNTFRSNLDHICPGLRAVVYKLVDRTDLLDVVLADLSEGYVLDNDGGIHPYYYEANNVNFGHYESISNGVVESIDPDHYHMLSPSLYVKKGMNTKDSKRAKKESEEISLFRNLDVQSTEFDDFERVSNGDGTQTVRCIKGGRVVVAYTYSVDNHKIKNLKMEVFDNVRAISNNPALTEIQIAFGVQVGDISNNSALTKIRIAERARVDSVNQNPNLAEIEIGEATGVNDISNNPNLTKLSIAKGAGVESIVLNPSLSELWIGEEVEIYDLRENAALTQLTIAKNALVNTIAENPNLTEIWIGDEARVNVIRENHALVKINVGRVARVLIITKNNRLAQIDLAAEAKVREISLNHELTTLILGEGAVVKDSHNNLMLAPMFPTKKA